MKKMAISKDGLLTYVTNPVVGKKCQSCCAKGLKIHD